MLAWGRNDSNHQAEIPDLWDPAGPWQIAAEAKVATISAGEYINVVLFDNGQVACWGDNSYGVDPRPLPAGEHPHLPADMPFHPDYSLKFKQAVAGGHFVALLTESGEIITYGAMTYGSDPTNHWSESQGIFGPGFRGGPSLSGPWAINNESSVPNSPLKYRPPYRGLATTHHSLMALVDPERADHPEDAWLLDMWGSNAGNVRLNQPLPDKMRFLELAGGSYQPWVVAKDLNTGELVAWGNTIAQVFPNPAPFGAFEVRPGNSNIQVVALCYDPNCDGSTTAPVLTAADFQCFQNAFAAAQSLSYEEQIKSYANCDGSTTVPVLTGNDWICFSNKYAAGGCP